MSLFVIYTKKCWRHTEKTNKIFCAKGVGTGHMDNRTGGNLTIHLHIYFLNHVNMSSMN